METRMPEHRVRQGQCVHSIAKQYGVPWQRIWEHEQNAQLRERRDGENILYPGDVVFVPEREARQETGTTDQRHRFRVRGRSVRFRIRLVQPVGQQSGAQSPSGAGGNTRLEPRSNVAFQLEVDGRTQSGTADNDGVIDVPVPADATQGRLIINPGPEQEMVTVRIGYVNPLSEISGVRQRLTNLGFCCGDESEDEDESLIRAVRRFQQDQGLEVTGQPDQATRDRLREVHGS
jgi:hypothetical protein